MEKEKPKKELTPAERAIERDERLKITDVKDASIEQIQQEARIYVYKELKRINAGKNNLNKNTFTLLTSMLKLLLAPSTVVSEKQDMNENIDKKRAADLLTKFNNLKEEIKNGNDKTGPDLKIAVV